MLAVLVYSCCVSYFDVHYFPHQEVKEVGGVTITGVIMSVLLVFRTNTAYDRWWEGRKLWGQLVNEIRNLGLKSRNYLTVNQEQRREFADLLIAFPYALRDHLRGQRPSQKVLSLISTVDQTDHVPLHITDLLFLLAHVRTTDSTNAISDRLTVDPHLRALMDICGSCERILNSPISRTYTELIWLGLILYLLMLPWVLVPIIDIWCIPVIFLAAWFAVSLELLAEETEEPFGTDPNDLPLDDLCATIERSIRQLAD